MELSSNARMYKKNYTTLLYIKFETFQLYKHN